MHNHSFIQVSSPNGFELRLLRLALDAAQSGRLDDCAIMLRYFIAGHECPTARHPDMQEYARRRVDAKHIIRRIARILEA